MIVMTLADIARVTNGRVIEAETTAVSGAASLDSRHIESGGLFAAVAGDHVDGHDFVAAAFEQGAAAALVAREVDGPAVVVDDVTTALGALAHHVVERLRPPLTVTALTGSQGKTSVKDLIAQGLRSLNLGSLASPSLPGEVVATAGNFNNELGVPVTALRATTGTRDLVVEMGARGIGHIRGLCEVVRPDVALVLNVGTAHIGEFGSQANIAVAKGEIIEALDGAGLAILNADDPNVSNMSTRTDAAVAYFGYTADTSPGNVRIDTVEMQPNGEPTVTFEFDGQRTTVHVPLLGAHQAMNAAAAACVVIHRQGALGLPPDLDWLANVRTESELRLHQETRADGVIVIDDTYNANPESMRAGLDVLAALTAPRRLAVLGPMFELGPTSAEAHFEVGRYARDVGLDRVVVIGDEAREIADGAGDIASLATNVEEGVSQIQAWLQPHDAVLVKASRGARLERVTNALLNE